MVAMDDAMLEWADMGPAGASCDRSAIEERGREVSSGRLVEKVQANINR